REVQDQVERFKALDIINQLPQESKEFSMSLLFVHYALYKEDLMRLLEKLITESNGAYMAECYEPNSLVRNVRYRDDLYSVLSLLHQFYFKFEARTSSEILVAHPVSRIKSIVRSI